MRLGAVQDTEHDMALTKLHLRSGGKTTCYVLTYLSVLLGLAVLHESTYIELATAKYDVLQSISSRQYSLSIDIHERLDTWVVQNIASLANAPPGSQYCQELDVVRAEQKQYTLAFSIWLVFISSLTFLGG